MKKIFNYIELHMFHIIITFFIIALFSVIGIYLYTPEDYTDNVTKPNTLEGCEYKELGNNSLKISKKIEIDESGKTICFKTYDSEVKASINNKIIYEFKKIISAGNSPGSKYNFISIPAYSAGKELEIVIDTYYDNKYQSNYEIIIGDKDEIIASLILNERKDILTVLLSIVISVLLFILYFLGKKNRYNNKSLLYLGLLVLFFAIWSSASTFFIQFILKNAVVSYYMNYYSLFLTCLLFVLYMDELTPQIKLKYEFVTLLFTCILISSLHALNIYDFTELMRPYLIIVVIIFSICIVRLIHDAYVIKDNKLKLKMAILFIFALIQIFYYLFNINLYNHSLFIKIGFYIYITLAVIDGTEEIIQSLVKAKDAETLEKIAFNDNLTGLLNRSAFERDLANIPLSEMTLISFDLNNLKYYNDNYGHAYGDELLKLASKALCDCFSNVYRMGGDEFVVIEKNISENNIVSKINKFKDILDKHNNVPGCRIILEIAAGYSSYEEKDTTYEDILKRADKLMYKDKAAIKAVSRVKKVSYIDDRI